LGEARLLLESLNFLSRS